MTYRISPFIVNSSITPGHSTGQIINGNKNLKIELWCDRLYFPRWSLVCFECDLDIPPSRRWGYLLYSGNLVDTVTALTSIIRQKLHSGKSEPRSRKYWQPPFLAFWNAHAKDVLSQNSATTLWKPSQAEGPGVHGHFCEQPPLSLRWALSRQGPQQQCQHVRESSQYPAQSSLQTPAELSIQQTETRRHEWEAPRWVQSTCRAIKDSSKLLFLAIKCLE